MKLAEIWPLVVDGERVRHADLQPGVYIDYNFSGLRINFPNGSSSGYATKAEDETVEWELVKQGWGSYEPPKPKVEGWASYG
jgi:hypothetical protein